MDIHVPHGDFAAAEKVRKIMIDAGFKVATYSEIAEQPLAFEKVLETAIKLDVPTIRTLTLYFRTTKTKILRTVTVKYIIIVT